MQNLQGLGYDVVQGDAGPLMRMVLDLKLERVVGKSAIGQKCAGWRRFSDVSRTFWGRTCAILDHEAASFAGNEKP